MMKNFNQLRQLLETNFPELRGRVRGSNYPAPLYATILSYALTFFQFFTFVVMYAGDSIWRYVPFMRGQAPEWYYTMKQNGIPVLIALFLILPTVIQAHVKTGAFEVYLDGAIVFSKLGSGRMPTIQDVYTPLVQAGLTKLE